MRERDWSNFDQENFILFGYAIQVLLSDKTIISKYKFNQKI